MVLDKCLLDSVLFGFLLELLLCVKNLLGLIYVNMEFLFVENGENEFWCSFGSSRSSVSFNEGLSLSSIEDVVFREIDVLFYENVRDVFECSKFKEKSFLVDIVYSDLYFYDLRLFFFRGLKFVLEIVIFINGLDKKFKVEEILCCFFV